MRTGLLEAFKKRGSLSKVLRRSSIGPHAEEFSCGGIPAIQIYLRPLKSLQRGQVVSDAILRNPHLLVA